MIAAIDNFGETYISLTQVNTNESVFSCYLEKLVAVLNKERPGWKEDTVLLVDGAKYHKSGITRQVFQRIGCQVCFTGPYSYETAPIELYFSLMKKTNLNPTRAKTGKK